MNYFKVTMWPAKQLVLRKVDSQKINDLFKGPARERTGQGWPSLIRNRRFWSNKYVFRPMETLPKASFSFSWKHYTNLQCTGELWLKIYFPKIDYYPRVIHRCTWMRDKYEWYFNICMFHEIFELLYFSMLNLAILPRDGDWISARQLYGYQLW